MLRGIHGEGSIFQRQDGRWQASLMVGGVRRTVYGKTRKDAADKLRELKRQAAGGLPDPGRRTVADLISAWLRTAGPNLKPRTLMDYRQRCKLHILPALGEVKLAKLEPLLIERVLAELQAQGHRKEAQMTYALLHRACVFAVRWRWLAENPCSRVLRPQYQAGRKDVWTGDQLRAFLKGTGEHWLAPLWFLAIASGCRLAELLGLGWVDVDFAGCSIRIRRNLQRAGGEIIIGEPKTAAGVRTVALPSEAVETLKRQQGQQAMMVLTTEGWHNELGLVFTNTHGGPLFVSTVDRALRAECDRIGLPRVSAHGLRHLHASVLLNEGLPLPAVSARLGHADPSITARIYSHVIGNRDDAGARYIARAMGSGDGGGTEQAS